MTVLLIVIAAGVVYLCLNQPIPAAGKRRSWLQQAAWHLQNRRSKR